MDRKSFWSWPIIGLILATVVTASCAPAAAPGKPTGEPYKIGASVPLTGPAASLGEGNKKGAMLAVERINAAGGINGHLLELVIYDDETKPELAAENTKKLIERDKVLALGGFISYVSVGPAAPLAQEAKVPMQIGTPAYKIDPAKETYVFGIVYTLFDHDEAMLADMKKRGWTRIAALLHDDAMGELMRSNYETLAQKYGMTILGVERASTTAKDVSAQVAKLKALQPQALVAPLSGAPAALAINTAEQMGLKVPIYVGTANLSAPFLKLIEGTSATVVTPAPKVSVYKQIPDSDLLKPQMKDFFESFVARYGTEPAYIETLGYDNINAMAAALKAVGPDREKIRGYLENLKDYKAVGGIFNRSPQNHNGFGIESMTTAKAGKDGWVLFQ